MLTYKTTIRQETIAVVASKSCSNSYLLVYAIYIYLLILHTYIIYLCIQLTFKPCGRNRSILWNLTFFKRLLPSLKKGIRKGTRPWKLEKSSFFSGPENFPYLEPLGSTNWYCVWLFSLPNNVPCKQYDLSFHRHHQYCK